MARVILRQGFSPAAASYRDTLEGEILVAFGTVTVTSSLGKFTIPLENVVAIEHRGGEKP